MYLFRMEMKVEILFETSIGKTIKYLSDFCELYKEEFPELQHINTTCQGIIVKWKNMVNNIYFDEKKSFAEEFSKQKYKQKLLSK